MLKCTPRPEGDETEGKSDSHPLWIQQVTAVTFEKALDWTLSSPGIRKNFQASREEWLDLYHFSDRFAMEALNQVAKEGLRKATGWKPMEMIEFAQAENLGLSWATPAFQTICTHPRPFSIKESCNLPYNLFAMVVYIREMIAKRHTCFACQRGTPRTDRYTAPSDAEIESWINEGEKANTLNDRNLVGHCYGMNLCSLNIPIIDTRDN
ncbi:hypothetical protein DL96DRAFT_1634828 [Flagelloscypha sp. PMI_526]|nr:hypothetical protein DL96DRAFT_1634828 [Flagelloscypha sp. PMI_526]